jgi:hypothetical protein
MKYSPRVVLLSLADALWICDQKADTLPSLVHAPREMAINDVPREVIDAARAAFDARHPAHVEVLGLLHDSRDAAADSGAGSEHVLRFSNGESTVVATVTPKDELLQVAITVESDGEDLAVAIEQLVPALRLVRHGRAPAVFDEVHRGFVSITGTHQGSSEPAWCTAWVRL